MQYIIGQDDGTNVGPFNDKVEALRWSLTQLSADDVIEQYRDEAVKLLEERKANDPVENTLLEKTWVREAIDVLDSVDWVFFGVEIFGIGHISDVLDEDDLHAPDEGIDKD